MRPERKIWKENLALVLFMKFPACFKKLAAEIVNFGRDLVVDGLTIDEIDKKLLDFAVNKLKIYPALQNYQSCPKSLCTSKKENLCQGISGDSKLQEPNTMNLDVPAYCGGKRQILWSDIIKFEAIMSYVRNMVADEVDFKKVEFLKKPFV